MSWLNEKLSDWADGGRMLGKSLRFLVQYPSLMLPLIVIWLLSVHFIFFALPRIPWRGMGLGEVIGVVYLLNAGLCLLQLAGCSVLLELLQHIETGRPVRLGRALWDTLVRNLYAILPLAMIWSLIEVTLWILEALLTSKKRRSDSLFDESAAVEGFFDMVQKGLRMGTFLALPAIAWEEAGPIRAIRRSIKIIRSRFATFVGALSFSSIFIGLVGLPVLLIYKLAPDWADAHWQWLLFYGALLWTLKTYLEQMMMAELYLWARSAEWAEFARAADPLPRLFFKAEIVPSLFNGVPDLRDRLRIPTR